LDRSQEEKDKEVSSLALFLLVRLRLVQHNSLTRLEKNKSMAALGRNSGCQ
jgi:hypothetical protein